MPVIWIPGDLETLGRKGTWGSAEEKVPVTAQSNSGKKLDIEQNIAVGTCQSESEIESWSRISRGITIMGELLQWWQGQLDRRRSRKRVRGRGRTRETAHHLNNGIDRRFDVQLERRVKCGVQQCHPRNPDLSPYSTIASIRIQANGESIG